MNRKILLGLLVVIALSTLAYITLFVEKDEKVLADRATLVAYTNNGASIGKGLLYFPFLKELTNAEVIASLDFNDDDLLTEDEKVVQAIRLNSRADWNSGVAIVVPASLTGDILAEVTVNGKTFKIIATVQTEDVGSLLDLGTVTDADESMKDWVNHANAQEPVESTYRPGVPDITQRVAECAPTAAANSLLSLAQEHGKSLSDLPSPTEIIDGLKQDMDWTPENGALPNEFVQGKNEWAVKHNLPIRTSKVGDKNGLSTLQALLDAMDQGAAAELRITFGDPATGQATGGHMVTVVGIRTEGGQNFIEINDPKTPEGTETYELSANVIEGYPYDGVAVLSWGFVQVWDEQAPSNLEPLTDAEVSGIKDAVGIKEKMKVINFRNKQVPLAQVHVGKGTECDEKPHYHANNGSVTALDGTVFTDPGECGYGKVTEVPVETIEIN